MINRCTEECTSKSPQLDSPLTEYVPGEHSSVKTSPLEIVDTLRQYAPDEGSLGVCYFFKGISLSYLHCLDESFVSFEEALNSSFAMMLTEEEKLQNKLNYPDNYYHIEYNRNHNRMLCYFAIAKIFQRKGNHLIAIEYFSKSLEVLPENDERAFIYFRRAWSYKVIKRFYLFIVLIFFIFILPTFLIFMFV